MKALNFVDNWPEYLALTLLIVGFILSQFSQSLVVTYAIVLFCGFAAGRIWYRGKKEPKGPYFILVVGFLIGFVLGARYGSKEVIIISYLIGILASYYLHETGILKTREM